MYQYETCQSMWLNRGHSFDQRQYVNVYGVVSDPTAVAKTRGSDSKMTLKIFDETTSTQGVVYGSADDLGRVPSSIQVTFFDSNPYELPRPAEGDIIRIHRLTAQMFNGKPQFICKTGALNGAGTSKSAWCLFHGDGESTEPYAQSSQNASVSDGRRINALREYARRAQTLPFMDEFGSKDPDNKLRRICDIKQQEFFDLYCLILDAHFVEGSDGSYVMLVWDGTDAPPLPPSMTTALSEQRNEMNVDHRDLELESDLDKQQFYAHGFLKNGQDELPEKENHAMPRIGSAFPIFMHSSKVELDEIPNAGEWVKIRNLNTQVVRGQLQGFVRRETSFVRNKKALPDLIRQYDERKLNNVVAAWGAPHNSPALTVTTHPNMRYSTIREMLLSKPPMRHKLRVVIRGFSPDVEKMCTPKPGTASGFQYGVCLRVIDGTDTVDVYVAGEEAERFFHNITPADLKKDAKTRERVASRLARLTKHEQLERTAPWIDLCVMQYIVRDAQSAKRCFQVFGTSIVS
uniref:Protection of telomeres protein 1 n=3 Tax=Ostreococcus mediterraneus TaxID=1486918 RepID=A0A6U0FJG1_9CHLO|mmetsp:Transcript_8782/g.32654  ORF Transcript_8782/g.32654 Transcript_8782/m.32654 type:complete len:517 (+) Transcript_8782:224-1774(+)